METLVLVIVLIILAVVVAWAEREAHRVDREYEESWIRIHTILDSIEEKTLQARHNLEVALLLVSDDGRVH